MRPDHLLRQNDAVNAEKSNYPTQINLTICGSQAQLEGLRASHGGMESLEEAMKPCTGSDSSCGTGSC